MPLKKRRSMSFCVEEFWYMWMGLDWEKFRFRINGLGIDVLRVIFLRN